MSIEDIKRLQVQELKTILSDHGQPVTGKKADLIHSFLDSGSVCFLWEMRSIPSPTLGSEDLHSVVGRKICMRPSNTIPGDLVNQALFIATMQKTNSVAYVSIAPPKPVIMLGRTKWHKSRVQYYSNSTASFNSSSLIIEHSGDVHPHPGPDSGLVKTIPVHTSNRLTSTNNNPYLSQL